MLYKIEYVVNSKYAEFVTDLENLFKICNYFEQNKTNFKVTSGQGPLRPEMFNFAPIEQWEHWKISLF